MLHKKLGKTNKNFQYIEKTNSRLSSAGPVSLTVAKTAVDEVIGEEIRNAQ